jgi:acylphosphatase
MSDEDLTHLRVRIEGFVQAVGFRNYVMDEARKLELDGWVRNRSDGTVEMLATGPDDALAALLDASRHGPRMAEVMDVAIEDAEPDGSTSFAARATE